MNKILILGAGAMGSAFSFPCADKNHKVTIVGTSLENLFIDNMLKNNNFHPSLKLNLPKKVKIIKSINLNVSTIDMTDLIVLAVSSKGINWAVEELTKKKLKKKLPPILMLTKGLSIYKNQYELLVDKLKRLLLYKGFKSANITVVGGPCLANGLANKVHSSVIFANKNKKTLRWLTKILSTKYYHISSSNDVIGVEVCAAIKNIYSIVIGASKGICNDNLSSLNRNKFYLNTSSVLFTQCLHEMEKFVNSLKGKKITVKGLAGLGDLHVSAAGGRNSMMGSHIGNGVLYSEAKKKEMKNITVEGVELIFEIESKIRKDFDKKQFPLLFGMIDSITKNKKIKLNWKNFNIN